RSERTFSPPTRHRRDCWQPSIHSSSCCRGRARERLGTSLRGRAARANSRVRQWRRGPLRLSKPVGSRPVAWRKRSRKERTPPALVTCASMPGATLSCHRTCRTYGATTHGRHGVDGSRPAASVVLLFFNQL